MTVSFPEKSICCDLRDTITTRSGGKDGKRSIRLSGSGGGNDKGDGRAGAKVGFETKEGLKLRERKHIQEGSGCRSARVGGGGLRGGAGIRQRLRGLAEGLVEVEMEQRQEGHGGGCNLVGG